MATQHGHGKRWRRVAGSILGPALMAALVTLVLAAAQSVTTEAGLSDWERQALGWMLIHRPSRPTDSRVALVAVDTSVYEDREAREFPPDTPPGRKALNDYRAPDCDCPGVPRECYALAVQRLHRWGASAVVLDIMFRSKVYSP